MLAAFYANVVKYFGSLNDNCEKRLLLQYGHKGVALTQ